MFFFSRERHPQGWINIHLLFLKLAISVVFCRVMMFEGKANESNTKRSGPPPERDIASLP